MTETNMKFIPATALKHADTLEGLCYGVLPTPLCIKFDDQLGGYAALKPGRQSKSKAFTQRQLVNDSWSPYQNTTQVCSCSSAWRHCQYAVQRQLLCYSCSWVYGQISCGVNIYSWVQKEGSACRHRPKNSAAMQEDGDLAWAHSHELQNRTYIRLQNDLGRADQHTR